MITVRTSTPDDAKGIAEVEASATGTLRQTYRPNRKALSHKSSIAGKLVRLVAESDRRIVGTTQYYREGNALRIIGLGVHRDFRRHGVARALVSSVADRARSDRLCCVAARTVKETGNVPILEALGFEVVSECPDEYSVSVAGGQLTDVSLRMKIDQESGTSGSNTTR